MFLIKRFWHDISVKFRFALSDLTTTDHLLGENISKDLVLICSVREILSTCHSILRPSIEDKCSVSKLFDLQSGRHSALIVIIAASHQSRSWVRFPWLDRGPSMCSLHVQVLLTSSHWWSYKKQSVSLCWPCYRLQTWPVCTHSDPEVDWFGSA